MADDFTGPGIKCVNANCGKPIHADRHWFSKLNEEGPEQAVATTRLTCPHCGATANYSGGQLRYF